MPARDALPTAVFLVLVAIWGSTWLAIKAGLEGLAPLWGAGLRVVVAGAVLALASLALGLRLPARGDGLRAALIGVPLYAGNLGLIYWGEQGIATGLSAVLFAVFPLLTGVWATLLIPGEGLTRRRLAGALLGVAGVATIFRGSLAVSPGDGPYMAAMVGSAASAALGFVLVRGWARRLHPVPFNAVAMPAGGAALLAASALLGERWALPATTTAWWSLAYLVAFGSLAAFLLYQWLLQRWDATRASYLSLLTPLVAVGLGAAVYGERVTWSLAAGGALVLAGVYLGAVRGHRRGAPR